MSDSVGSRRRRKAGWPVAARPEFAPLAAGDAVAVVATGFAVLPDRLSSGLDVIRRLGYDPRPGAHVRDRLGYLAGPDDARLEDLLRAWHDPATRALWFARGGYGTARLLTDLPWRRLARRPKLLVGYSDVTALFAALLSRTPGLCLYGPVAAELGTPDAWHRPSLRALLRGEDVTIPISRRAVLRSGRARGRLLGGNLTVLTHLIGTRDFPSLDGAVLALEDVGEEVYRVDRMLDHLRRSGALRGIAGVCLGSFASPPPAREFPGDRDLVEVLREAFAPLGVPVVRDLPFGHVRRKRTLPLGALCTLDTEAGAWRLEARPAP